ncbi:MAG: LysR family transcriptional regulator [Sphingomonadaceae bacterium]
MIKRSHIRQFLAVVEAGSFTQAAASLHITQPTLSAGISDLERMVGTKLFVRNRRRIRMTEAGGKFLPIARDLDHNFQVADNFGQSHQSDWPDCRIGILPTLPDIILQQCISQLSAHYSLEIVEGSAIDLRKRMERGRIDLAITLIDKESSAPDSVALIHEPYVMFAHKNHELARRDSVMPEELASEIMIARRSCELLEETSRFFTRHRVRPRFSLRSDNDARCLTMVAAGIGITTAPLSFADERLAQIPVYGYDYHRIIGFRLSANWQEDTERLSLVRQIAASLDHG